MNFDMIELTNYLKEFGFNEKDITIICSTYPLNTLRMKTLFQYIKGVNNFFLENNFTRKEIIHLIRRFPVVYGELEYNLIKKLDNLIRLGIRKDLALKIIKKDPRILIFSVKRVDERINSYLKMGYQKDEVLKMLIVHPQIITYNLDSINKKIQELIKFGFSYEQVLKITKEYPAILSLNLLRIKERVKDLEAFGYSKEVVIKMIYELPTLLGYAKESLKDKIFFYKNMGLEETILKTPKQLMQSVKLSYARYEYLRSLGIEITNDNSNLLFAKDKRFQNKWFITKEKLLESYPEVPVSYTSMSPQDYLINFGYNSQDVAIIFNKFCFKHTPLVLLNNLYDIISFLLFYGFTKKEIIKISLMFPALFSFNVNTLKNKFSALEGLGYNPDQIIKIAKSHPIILGITIDLIKKRITYFESLGFNHDQIIKFSSSGAGVGIGILSFSSDTITNKINYLEKMGFTKDQIMKMIKLCPLFLSIDINNMHQKILGLIDLGYTLEEAIYLLSKFPALFANSFSTIKRKILFYESIGLGDFIKKHPAILMQSIELSYARLKFLQNNSDFNLLESPNSLFINSKVWQKRFGMTKEELLKTYPYPKDEVTRGEE